MLDTYEQASCVAVGRDAKEAAFNRTAVDREFCTFESYLRPICKFRRSLRHEYSRIESSQRVDVWFSVGHSLERRFSFLMDIRFITCAAYVTAWGHSFDGALP